MGGRTHAQRLPSGWSLRALTVTLALLSAGCTCSEPPRQDETAPSALVDSSNASPQENPAPKTYVERLDLLPTLGSCDLTLGGQAIDFAEGSSEYRRAEGITRPAPLAHETKAGVTTALLDRAETSLRFWLTEPAPELALGAEIEGRGSSQVAAYIDGVRLGSARLGTGKPSVISLGPKPGPFPAGAHTLRISLSRTGKSRLGAALRWVRIGPPGTLEREAPPPLAALSTEVTLGEEQHRALVLRRGATLRCPVRPPRGAKLRTTLGVWGNLGATAEIALIREDGSRTVLLREALEAPDPKDKDKSKRTLVRPVEVELAALGDEPGYLEFSAPEVDAGGRLAFADPEILITRRAPTEPPRAKRAVVILLSGLGTRHLPPAGGSTGLTFIPHLRRQGTVFSSYRAITTSPVGVVASLLTGRAPWVHQVDGLELELGRGQGTLGEALEARGGRAAMFTGVPTSFGEFGLSRGFERFVSISPAEDRPATAPLDDAKIWLEKRLGLDAPVLAVVHLRGAHPPYDVTQERARELPPSEYGGDLEPRRAAVQLHDVRARTRASARRLPREDWLRLASLEDEALLAQSRAIVEFSNWLASVDDETLLVVLGDVSSGTPPEIPYSPDAPLDIEYTSSPLLAVFPHGHRAREREEAPVSTLDVTHTLASMLGVELDIVGAEPLHLGEDSELAEARSRVFVASRAGHAVATLGRFELRLDKSGARLCELDVDPGCLDDRSAKRPILARLLDSAALAHLAIEPTSTALPERRSESKRLDDALTVFGLDP